MVFYEYKTKGKVNHIYFNVCTVGYFGGIGSFKLAKSYFYIAIWLALAGDSILCNSSNFLFFCKRFTQIVDKGEFRSYNECTSGNTHLTPPKSPSESRKASSKAISFSKNFVIKVLTIAKLCVTMNVLKSVADF